MFYSKKSQFFHRARNYSNNPKKLAKKWSIFTNTKMIVRNCKKIDENIHTENPHKIE